MTVIRFSRHGSKKRPYFRIVVQDKAKPRDGRFIEHIGSYVPTTGQSSFNIKRDRLEYWLGVGAQPSESVENRLKVLRKQWAAGGAPETSGTVKEAPKKAKPKAAAKEA